MSSVSFPLDRRACMALLATALAPFAAPAHGQARAVTLIVPFPAGGPTDVVARAVGQRLSETLGQTVVVDNKPGASGNIGAAAAARAAPDGNTLLVGTAALMTSPFLYKLNYDPLKDFAPVAMLAKMPVFIWVDEQSPWRTLPDLLAAVKAQPGKYNYSSSAPGTLAHLGSLRFLDEAGARLTHINYKGSAQALNDFLGGVFPIYFEVAQPLVPHLKAGKVRALAVVASKRSPSMPGVPSIAELGFPGIDAFPFLDLMAPAGTPADVVARLNEHARRALQSPDVRARLGAAYMDVADDEKPAAVGAWLHAESAKWGEVIRKNNLRVD